jgi:hypothetical protein
MAKAGSLSLPGWQAFYTRMTPDAAARENRVSEWQV